MEPQNTAPTNQTPASSPVSSAPVVTPSSPTPKSNHFILIIVLIVVIAAAGGIGFMALRKNLTPPAPLPTPAVQVIQTPVATPTVASPSATPMPEIKSAADVTTQITDLDTSIDAAKSTDFDPNSLSDL